MKKADVFYRETKVGQLVEDENGYSFSYDEDIRKCRTNKFNFAVDEQALSVVNHVPIFRWSHSRRMVARRGLKKLETQPQRQNGIAYDLLQRLYRRHRNNRIGGG